MSVKVVLAVAALFSAAAAAAWSQAPNETAAPAPGAASQAAAPATAPKPAASPPNIVAAPPAADVAPVEFTRLVLRLPVGQPYAVNRFGSFCNGDQTKTWPGGQTDMPIATLKDTFKTTFQSAGLKVAGAGDNLFDSDPSTADVAVAGVISALDMSVCWPHNLVGPGSEKQKGTVSLTIDWEVYSRLQKKMLASVRTTGQATLDEETAGGNQILLNNAFQANVVQLAASADVRKALTAAVRGADELVQPPTNAPIYLAGAEDAQNHAISDAAKSVVLIRTGGTEGSGVLVSRDGYIVTAAHVIGQAPSVDIKWPDGRESTAQVVRVSAGRDVALLKTGDQGTPLALKSGPPTIGDSVFAVGALYGHTLQDSVIGGVVSGQRVFDGYSYLQSDAKVGPGVSGGPLLDSKGRVVGITVQFAALPAGAPLGVSLFVPTKDVVSFLALAPPWNEAGQSAMEATTPPDCHTAKCRARAKAHAGAP